jgi:NAD(P)-dependent dehydrogenase (short-subunit alcohol dehydrogenase family)
MKLTDLFVLLSNIFRFGCAHFCGKAFFSAQFTQMAPYGINLNAIAPGTIDVGTIPVESEILKQAIKTIPIGRMVLPSDIANLAVFLASDESNYITGQCIVCDGGYSIP